MIKGAGQPTPERPLLSPQRLLPPTPSWVSGTPGAQPRSAAQGERVQPSACPHPQRQQSVGLPVCGMRHCPRASLTLARGDARHPPAAAPMRGITPPLAREPLKPGRASTSTCERRVCCAEQRVSVVTLGRPTLRPARSLGCPQVLRRHMPGHHIPVHMFHATCRGAGGEPQSRHERLRPGYMLPRSMHARETVVVAGDTVWLQMITRSGLHKPPYGSV